MVKIGKYILGAVLSTALLIVTSSCARKPDYELTREVVQDDETGMSYELIRNPSEPIYGEKGSAAKVLEIGDPGGLATDADGNYVLQEGVDENYIFADIRDVFFKDDTIYVADKLEENIRIFDTHGDYKETIGRKGQGPGEFSRIYKIYVDDNGFLYVFEWNHSLHVFNNDLKEPPKYRMRSLVKGLTEVYDIASIDSENFLLHGSFRLPFTSAITASDNKNEELFVRLNKDGEWFSFGPNRGFPGFKEGVESLKSVTPPRGSMNYSMYYSMILSHKNMFLDQRDNLLYSSTKAFPSRIDVHSSEDGNILRIMEKGIDENEPLYIIQEVNMDPREILNTPEVPFHMKWDKGKITEHFYFREEGMGIFADDANIYNFYRRLSKDGDNLRAQYFMDVFDLDGTYKQRVPLDMEIGSNFAGMDDKGNMVVFRKYPWPVVEKWQLGGIEK